MRFSSLEAGSTVRESGMGNLDDLLDLLGCQLAALLHQKLGRTVKAGHTQTTSLKLITNPAYSFSRGGKEKGIHFS
jgi:hypothetical protein